MIRSRLRRQDPPGRDAARFSRRARVGRADRAPSAAAALGGPNAPVADAAERGDNDAVVALLKQAADVNAPQGDGMTALHWAAMRNDAALATMLLYAGANPKATTRVGAYTPLLLAATNGHAAVMTPILEAGADVNAKTSNGTTALMLAAASGDVGSVDALIARGADLNARESTRGLTAAMFAAGANRAAVITVLAKHGADLTASTTPIDLRNLDRSAFAGVLFGNPEPPKTPGGAAGSVEPGGRYQPPAAGQTRTAGFDRDYSGNELVHTQGGMTPLLLAARQGFIETARALVDAGVDVNQTKTGDRTSAMLIATINGHFDLAKFLLDRGADPNLTALNGVDAAVCDAESRMGAEGRSSAAARAPAIRRLSYLDLMQALLDKGADPNARLLTQGVVFGQLRLSVSTRLAPHPSGALPTRAIVDAMKLLVSRGADPNIPTVKRRRAAAHRRWSA